MNPYTESLFSFFSSGENKDQIETRKKEARFVSPASTMYEFGDSAKFTAFIYSSKNNLYCQSGDKYHNPGINPALDQGILGKAKLEPPDSTFLFGRFGVAKKIGGFVTIWRTSNFQGDNHYKLNIGTNETLRQMLKAMISGSTKIIGESPAKYPIKPNYIIISEQMEPTLVSEFLQQESEPKENPCQKIKINVLGRPTSIGTVIGNFHMVRGPELDNIKNAVCSQASQVKDELQKNNCQTQAALFDDIFRKSACKTGSQEYERAKKAGKAKYTQDLSKVFSNPEKIDTEFRGRQKDIDAAWDFYNKKENFSGFKQFLGSDSST